jgi:hypothetical protein
VRGSYWEVPFGAEIELICPSFVTTRNGLNARPEGFQPRGLEIIISRVINEGESSSATIGKLGPSMAHRAPTSQIVWQSGRSAQQVNLLQQGAFFDVLSSFPVETPSPAGFRSPAASNIASTHLPFAPPNTSPKKTPTAPPTTKPPSTPPGSPAPRRAKAPSNAHAGIMMVSETESAAHRF